MTVPPEDRELSEIDRFNSDEHYFEVSKFIVSLVNEGKLRDKGLDPSNPEPGFYVELYEDLDGQVWRLAVPDKAYRGYLRKLKPIVGPIGLHLSPE